MSTTPVPIVCAPRQRRPSASLRDPNNVGTLELSHHQEAQREARLASLPPSPTRRTTRFASAFVEDQEDDEQPPAARRPPAKRAHVNSNASEPDATTNAGPSIPAGTTAQDADEAPAEAAPEPEPVMVEHSDDESPSDEEAPAPRINRTADINYFFEDAVARGPTKKRFRKCKICPQEKWITCEVTTLRRHMQAAHKRRCTRWYTKNGVESKLPADVKARKATVADKQSTLDKHIDVDPAEIAPTITYSHPLFKELIEDWIITTNQLQPLDALGNDRLCHAFNLASRAKKGINIPEPRATRAHIIESFHKTVANLKELLNSEKVHGEVSLTCDAWQSSNRKGYFAVTRHWIEEVSPMNWKLRGVVLGFTEMNTSHTGEALGKALYAIAKHYGIEHKIGWVTCDNASNNVAMLQVFERKVSRRRAWNHRERHIRCLAHIINLATQAFLTTHSKTAHIDTDSTVADVDKALDSLAVDSAKRDIVGLIRLITVKARSSAKRSEMLRDLQVTNNVKTPLNLILDMRVRWSSTLAMLECAYVLKEYINHFIFKMASDETNRLKQRKIEELRVTPDKWNRVKEIVTILKQANKAQHVFSSEDTPTLAHAIPTLERLHKKWSAMATDKYKTYKTALDTGIEKVATYYNKTSSVKAYTFLMVLDPELKTTYFKKHWDDALENAAKDEAEEIFKARWLELNGNPPVPSRTTARPLTTMLSRSRLDVNDSDDDTATATAPTAAPVNADARPWMKEFKRYTEAEDKLDGQDLVSWWGKNSTRLPTWVSLAWDYLAIMASSVSSERAFSAAGITISKCRNALKADIVEALQVLRSHLNAGLVLREPEPNLEWEYENESGLEDSHEEDEEEDDENGDSESYWDMLIDEATHDSSSVHSM